MSTASPSTPFASTPFRAEPLHTRLTSRLAALKAELAVGERRLAELDGERAELIRTMLRISGAVQVLEDELSEPADAPAHRAA